MKSRITLSAVAHLPVGATLHDTELAGFTVRRQGNAAVYSVRGVLKGQKLRVTIGKHGAFTPHTARKQAQRLLGLMAGGTDPRAGKTTPLSIEAAAKAFLHHICAKRAPGTAREYEGHLVQHLIPAFGRKSLDSITTADFAKLHRDLRARPILANRVLATASSLYGWAAHQSMVPDGFNPTRRVERFKEESKQRFLSDAELRQLGNALREAEEEGRWSPYALGAIRLLLVTGCRRDEIRLMQWTMIDWQLMTFTTPSKRGRRVVHLNAPALAVLEALRALPDGETNPYVIAGSGAGEPHANLQDVWDHVRKRAKLDDVRIHDLRHSLASLAGAEGVSLPIIGALLGHKTAAATKRYTHLAGDPAKLASQRVGERAVKALG
jgi:integrase